MSFALLPLAGRSLIPFRDLFIAQESRFAMHSRPFALIQTGKNQMRPFLAFAIGIRKELNPAIRMIAFGRSRPHGRVENFLQPAQIDRTGEFVMHSAPPVVAESLHFKPALLPF